MKSLMIAVERVVRPIRAAATRKEKMRSDLLAHLAACYQEELGRLGNEQAALDEALRRFGNPTDLTADLQQTVPRLERFLHRPLCGFDWVDRLPRQAGAASRRLALKVAAAVAVLNFLAFLPPFLARLNAATLDGSLWLPAGCLALVAGSAFVMVLLCWAMCAALGQAGFRARLRAAGYALIALALQPISLAAYSLLLNGDLRFAFERWPRTLLVTAGFLVLLASAVLWLRARLRRQEEWTLLEID